MTRSVDFFEQQFQRQVQAADYALNPFERLVLPHLRGDVLDLGCGLGNLALAAAQSGCRVSALDASPTAIADLARRSLESRAAIEARRTDLEDFQPEREYDSVVAIGLLMFLPCEKARALLARLQGAVRPGGIAAVNVLVEGTTYMAMFDPLSCCLFSADELSGVFPRWEALVSRHDEFPAPGETIKRFHTIVARRPA